VYDEAPQPSPNNPFLSLQAGAYDQTIFRNARLEGSPVIPRQVFLCADDRLEGWTGGNRYDHPATSRSLPEPDARRPSDYSAGLEHVAWSVKNGILRGRRDDDARNNPYMGRRLRYSRPLRDGESVRYEFLYQPGAVIVHPSLDRLLFVLLPDGVQPIWTADPFPHDGFSREQEVDLTLQEPGIRLGPEHLPLRPGEWNTAELVLENGTVRVKLNDLLVCERPLESSNSRQFSFFFYRDKTAAEIRNVVLRGNWPEKLSVDRMANLFLGRPDKETEADARASRALLAPHLPRVEF
jgi:hypothetical protein